MITTGEYVAIFIGLAVAIMSMVGIIVAHVIGARNRTDPSTDTDSAKG